MKNFGFIPSLITPKTMKFIAPSSLSVPSKFSYRNFLSPVTNQFSNPHCIPHSVACWINWKLGMKTGIPVDNNVRYVDIYKFKKSTGEGMTYQEAFEYLKTKGVKTDRGVVKIKDVGYIPSSGLLKQALLANGPCFGALPVYNQDSKEFWKKTKSVPEGWHSITIIGWDEKGFIIRNSWGSSFADKGYTILPYDDVTFFRELWTILG